MLGVLLVGYVKGENGDNSVLTVGKRKEGSVNVDLIHAYKGPMADMLYCILLGKPVPEDIKEAGFMMLSPQPEEKENK